MGGKTSNTTQSVTVPQDVLNRYNSVNQQAQQAAGNSFNVYSTNPNAFVAPLTSTQQAGIAGTNAAAGLAQPYYGQATNELLNAQSASQPYYNAAAGTLASATSDAQPYNLGATSLALGGAQAVNADPITGQSINQYLSPYLGDVLGSESALLNQNNQQAMAGQLGNAITSGAFGGDRAGIAAANLNQQQQLANANIYSGILNTGYTNALNTAQQQQGVNLGAAQANRAALSGASGQLQGIGQQQFGQDITASQAQSGLGQLVYGTGAQTAQSLAGLGAGAQSAALEGSQAQLTAGQAQQQTQQAGLTALYNQFLQQQSYPFQVSQFLANIAEGTGALSGSTTTSTQPGGFFSDERLKEDIEPIGKTFDGQNIVAFRYKGDPRKQIGLVAQEVEHHHPDAVGLAAGYKTVDYDKATRKAADRGHFRRGGLAPANDNRDGYAYGGFMPDMAQALGAQASMYGPYTQGGLYGGSASGAPMGGSSYVPAASLPVGHLAVAGDAPSRPPSPVEQAGKVADLVNGIDKFAGSKTGKALGKNVSSMFKSGSGLGGASDDADDDDLYARGGLARAGFAAGGGMPYSQQVGLGLDIPDEAPDRSLPTPGSAPGQESGLDKVGKLAKTGAAVAKVASMFAMARGGVAERKRYAAGGVLDDIDDGDDGLVNAPGLPSAIPVTAREAQRPVIGQEWPSNWDRAPADKLASPVAQVSPADMRRFAKTGMLFPTSDEMQAIAAPREAGLGSAARSAAPRRHAGLAPTASSLPLAQDPTSLEGEGLVGPQGLSDQSQLDTSLPDGRVRTPSALSAGLSGAEQAIEHGAGRVGSKAKEFLSNKDNILPILAGIAAMGTAPTQHLGVALAAGLGAGAKTAMDVRKLNAQVGQTQAQTGLLGAQKGATETAAYQAMQAGAPPGTQAVPGPGPDGSKSFPGPDGAPWHYELKVGYANFGPSASGVPGAPGATPDAHGATVKRPPVATDYSSGTAAIGPSSDTDQYLAKTYGIDPSQPGVANFSRLVATNPQLAAQDESAQKAVQERIGNQGEADATHRQYVQLAQAINSLSSDGLTGHGANFQDRANLANIYDTYAGMLGVPPDPGVSADLSASQIIGKITALQGPALAHQYGERAASIAHSLSSVLPGGGMKLSAANEILSTMMIQNQQQRDLAQYYNSYVGRYGTAIGLEQAFQRDMGPVYDHEQKVLPKQMMRGNGKKSAAEFIISNPHGIRDFEQGWKNPDGTGISGYGDGTSRYWR